MKFTAAGDVLIQKRIADGYEGFKTIGDFIRRGDGRFFNLEASLNYEGECFASQFSGGTYVRTNPEVLGDIEKLGFNMTSANQNHIMDFSYEGLLRTKAELDASNFIHAGIGCNLDEAAAPRYLETPNGRVALIAVNTSFNPAMMAGRQTRRIPGRPGINGVRHDEITVVTPEQLKAVQEIGAQTHINAPKDITRKEGYDLPLPEGFAELGPNLRFRVTKDGEEPHVEMKVNQTDLKRVISAIEEAKFQSDYVMISIHNHQIVGESKETVPSFIREFAHSVIDAGANAVIGHGPHLLRGIEIYKDSPIFYSLGDFIIQLYNVEIAPEEFYNKYGVHSDLSAYELLKKRSQNFTVGLMEQKVMLETVVPYWETENGKITKLELLPIEVVTDGIQGLRGLPRVAKDPYFMERLNKLSEPFGVQITMKDGVGVCKW